MKIAEGNHEHSSAMIQERHGVAKDARERQIREFENTLHGFYIR